MNSLSEAISRWPIKQLMRYLVGTEYPWVPAAELHCVRIDFDGHINRGAPSAHGPIRYPHFDFSLSDFNARIDDLGMHNSGGPIHKAVFVHYGLDPNGELDIALEFVKLHYDAGMGDYTFTPGTRYYRPEGGRLQDIGGGHSAWYGTNMPGEEYTEQVVVRRTSDQEWEKFKSGTDVVASVHAYEHVLAYFVAHNQTQPPSDLMIRILPISTPKARQGDYETGFHQGCAWEILESLPDDNEYDDPFTHKAADLGSPCPPNSPRVKFQLTGLPRKTGC